MPDFPRTSGWPERTWRNVNLPDIARGVVPGARPYSVFGERDLVAGTEAFIRETGTPATFTVPNNIQLSVVSSSASDTGVLMIEYLDGDLVERSEMLTMTGTTPVLTAANDIRAINAIHHMGAGAVGTVTFSSGGVTYAVMPAGSVQYDTAVVRVPAGKRLMINAMYAGAASGSSAARVIVKLESTYSHGHGYADQGYFHPLGGIALQDNTTVMSGFGPFPIPAGEWVGFTALGDKDAKVTAGLFGWLEDE